MIFRRIAQHLRDQDWTAIAIEFVLLVIGVFLGIQVANWNAQLELDAVEREHLRTLREEIEKDIETNKVKNDFYVGVNAAGVRALAVLEGDQACMEDECWRLLVDLFHASQWTDVGVTSTTYAEMRRIGLPRTRTVSMALERYYSQSNAINASLNERPAYRMMVREFIPFQAQRAMWTSCHHAVGGVVSFRDDCPAGIQNEAAARAVLAIRTQPRILSTLTQWTSTTTAIMKYLGDRDAYATDAIAAIDKELGVSP